MRAHGTSDIGHTPHYRLVEVAGEIELRVEAPDRQSLFEEAARALAELQADDAHGAPTNAAEHVHVTGEGTDLLLVEWLNELLFRGEVGKVVYGEVQVARLDEHGLDAIVRGRAPTSPRTAVRAATWHRLRVERTTAGMTATVVLDV